MAQLDLYRVRGEGGYALEIQADLLSGLKTAAVVPLRPGSSSPGALDRLNPIFTIDGIDYVMVTQFIATIPRKELGPPVGSLNRAHYFDVINALDMLISGS
ncbi:CcdB family protein [Nitrospirillum amazonense]|uniref:CcdB family protein n=1 Tax=Nitrospirillum amazonense TaxID=28077 RepID=UPI0011A0840E|nr:CcdB family protein [Nitrospirillum amazonense]